VGTTLSGAEGKGRRGRVAKPVAVPGVCALGFEGITRKPLSSRIYGISGRGHRGGRSSGKESMKRGGAKRHVELTGGL